jgi:hypothetical protein
MTIVGNIAIKDISGGKTGYAVMRQTAVQQ